MTLSQSEQNEIYNWAYLCVCDENKNYVGIIKSDGVGTWSVQDCPLAIL